MTTFVKQISDLIARGWALGEAIDRVAESSSFRSYGLTREMLVEAYEKIVSGFNQAHHMRATESYGDSWGHVADITEKRDSGNIAGKWKGFRD
jgi:uncharacterized protein YoaH (UPF0181 family)